METTHISNKPKETKKFSLSTGSPTQIIEKAEG
jgi:hypothetical protein